MPSPGDSPARIARDAKAFLLQLEEEGLEWVPSRRGNASRRRPRPVASSTPRERYLELRARTLVCASCRLSETRRNVVFGEGKMEKGVFIIGEGPGATEDATGRPFVGRAGALLDKMLAAVDLSRRDVYITNIVKCRPPGNRDPHPDEIIACWPLLEAQLDLLRPRIVLALGAPAARTLLDTKRGIGSLRGRFHDFNGIPLLPTYHPAYILRSYTVENRRKVMDDLTLLRNFLDRPRD